ncbi:hypothetical protein [Halobaculum rarum]|uniref:hypothetical protein n=1 Tax=Halobaculum rarum TaxID=3075122 RepID=UPI0032B005D7
MPATTAAMTNPMTALDPIIATAAPDSEKIPAAIIVPRPIAKAILKSSVRVCSAIGVPITGEFDKFLAQYGQ